MTKEEKDAAKAADKEAKDAAKAADKEAKDAAKAADEDSEEETEQPENVLVRVFYKELTATGRDGANAHRQFTNRDDAEVFAAKVNGRVV